MKRLLPIFALLFAFIAKGQVQKHVNSDNSANEDLQKSSAPVFKIDPSAAQCGPVNFLTTGGANKTSATATERVRGAIAQKLRAPKKVQLDLYVMSQCPFGVLAEQTLAPLVREFGPGLDLRVNFIAGSELQNGKYVFNSMHGQSEIDEDIRQLIIARDYPEKQLAYLEARAENYRDGNWQTAATKAGIDVNAVSLAAARDESRELFRANIERAQTAGIHASPTLFIDGVRYEGDIIDPSSARAFACDGGSDPFTGATYTVCSATATTAWITSTQNGGGRYHALYICNSLGYANLGRFGGTCGNQCSYCTGGFSCTNPQANPTFDGGGSSCGSDANGPILCFTVHWECVGALACVAPTITCPTNMSANNAPNSCSAVVTYTSSTTGTSPTITYAFTGATTGSGSGNGSGSSFNVGVTTVTLTATNGCGTNSCSFTVTVNDVQPPTINCPGNITVGNTTGQCGTTVCYALPTISGSCTAPATPAGYHFLVQFGNSYYYQSNGQSDYPTAKTNAAAAGGHLAVITSPAENNAIASNGGGFAWIGGGDEGSEGSFHWATCEPFSYSNFCGGEPNGGTFENDLEFESGGCWNDLSAGASRFAILEIEGAKMVQTTGLPPGSVFPGGTTTNTFVATNAAGNSSSCSFTVTVNDTEPPVITCPPNIVVTTDPGQCYATVNFPTTMVLQYDPTGPQVSTTAVAPTFAAPNYSATNLAQSGSNASWTNIDVWPVGQISSSPTPVPGEYLSFQVTVPAGTDFNKIQYSKVAYLGNGATSASIRSSLDGFSSDISVIPVSPGGVEELSFDLSSMPVVSGMIEFRIYFYGAPISKGDWDDLVSTNRGGNGLRLYVNNLATASDNCGPVTISYANFPPDYKYSKGVNVVVATATDGNNNSSSCQFTVTVNDGEPPVLHGVPGDVTVQCDAVPPMTAANVTATDNCPGVLPVTVVDVITAGSCANSYKITRTWSAADADSHITYASQVITVIDNTAPVLTVPADVSVECSSVPAPGTATATDNCDGSPVVTYQGQVITPSTSSTTAFTGTRTNGNQNYNERLGMVFNANGPITVTQLGAYDDGQNGLSLPITVGIVRNSDGATMVGPITMSGTSDPLVGNYRMRNIAPVTLPAGQYIIVGVGYGNAELNGNSNVGGTSPAFHSGNGLLSLVSSPYGGVGFGKPTTAFPTPGIFHAGTFTIATVACANNYTITRTWKATDACLNSTTGSQTIYVSDHTAPQLMGTIPAGGSNMNLCYSNIPAGPTEAQIAALYADNCGVVHVTKTGSPTGNNCHWSVTYHYTISDDCGNWAAPFDISYSGGDTEAPHLTGTLPAGGSNMNLCFNAIPAGPTVAQITALYADNCGAVHVIKSGTPTGNNCSWTVTYHYVITDDCNNSTAINITYSGGDTQAPTFNRPFDKTIPFTSTCGYDASVANTGDVINEADNCSTGLNATYTDVVTQCGSGVIIKRTWHLVDHCGNAAADQVQTITATDNNTPYIIYATDEAKFGENNYIGGDVGVTAANGKAEFKKYDILDPYTVRAKNINTQSPSSVNNKVFSPATGGPNPTFYPFSGDTHGLPDYTVSVSTPVPISANYKNLTIKKNVVCTVTGTLYGHLTIEEGAQVTFNPSGGVLNVEEFNAKGKKEVVTREIFSTCTSVRISQHVELADNNQFNVNGPKVTVYCGDDNKDGENFHVKGKGVIVTANIYIPTGELHVDGSDDDTPTMMTGWFIIQKLHSDGKNVTWNKYSCTPPAFASNTGVTDEPTAKAAVPATPVFDVLVSPNPSRYDFRIQVTGSDNSPVTVRITDMSGRVISTRPQIAKGAVLTVGSELKAGSYFAEIIRGNNHKVIKLIKLD